MTRDEEIAQAVRGEIGEMQKRLDRAKARIDEIHHAEAAFWAETHISHLELKTGDRLSRAIRVAYDEARFGFATPTKDSQ